MIRLCILQAGEKDPGMPDGVPGYKDQFDAMFRPFPHFTLEYVQVRHGERPDSLDDWDAFLVTGSSAGVYDDHGWIAPLKELIRAIAESGKPLVGICFGHQIIAETLGGEARKSEKGWGLGLRRTDLTDPPPCLEGLGDAIELLYVHQDQVTAAPAGAAVFAGNDFCPIAAYHIGDRVLCFQGHPEFSTDVVEAIMDLDGREFGEGVTGEARKTLKGRGDSDAVIGAIVRFIEQAAGHHRKSVA